MAASQVWGEIKSLTIAQPCQLRCCVASLILLRRALCIFFKIRKAIINCRFVAGSLKKNYQQRMQIKNEEQKQKQTYILKVNTDKLLVKCTKLTNLLQKYSIGQSSLRYVKRQKSVLKLQDGFHLLPYNNYMSKELRPEHAQPQQDKIIDDGFSSDQEMQHEQIIVKEVKDELLEHNHKEEVKFKIPPPQEIKDKNYSLRADIETGWNCKLELPVPVPIIFQNERFDQLVRRALRQPRAKARVVYLGPRYQNTYYAWYDKTFPFPYNHIKAPNDMKFTNRPFCGQHWQAEDDLVFDSFFEGGNLDCVMKVGEREYDCFMRVDSNTVGHLQWFNFRIKGWKKLLKYKINICNFQKDKCLFARGMRPYIFSQKLYQKQKIGWRQQGQNVKFQRKALTGANVYDLDMRQMFRLSFQLYTPYQKDEIQISYCIPYTYSRLVEFLQTLTNRSQTKQFLKISKMCNSLGGLEVPLIIIHHGLQEAVQEEEGIPKRCIVVSGRAHPGQSNGSHMIQGFIEWLCGDTKQANILRRHVVFKIVPMLNPDGVVIGNYRTGLSGRDFNREYKMPDKALFPEVYHFKKLVTENKELFGDRLLMFLDFHGHSTKKNTFVYGPEFPIVERYYYEARIFPKLLGDATPMFRYYSCIFKINEFKESTARAVLLRRLGIPLSYTIQTSNGSYFDYEQLKDVPYTLALWREMGSKVGVALFEYIDLILSSDRNRIEKQRAKKRDKEKDKQHKKMSVKQSKVRSTSKRAEKVCIFAAMENEKIKHLFEEIKQAQEKKDKEKISDDELSEGSSDNQGHQDDLSPAQANLLFRMIKGGGCASLQRCKMRVKSKTSHKTTENIHIETAELTDEPSIQHHAVIDSEEVFRVKKAINIRKPIAASRQKICSYQQKKVSTAKVINFSFCSQTPRTRSKEDKQRFCLPPRLNFVQLVSGKWNEDRNIKRQTVNKNRVVMDLSDLHFRKTFTYNLRQKDEVNSPSVSIPSKRGRFEYYKYKRLLLNNEGEQA